MLLFINCWTLVSAELDTSIGGVATYSRFFLRKMLGTQYGAVGT